MRRSVESSPGIFACAVIMSKGMKLAFAWFAVTYRIVWSHKPAICKMFWCVIVLDFPKQTGVKPRCPGLQMRSA